MVFQEMNEWNAPRSALPDPSATPAEGFIVLGMGRIGTDLYDRVQELWGPCVIGVDADDDCVAGHVAAGRQVVHGDASDFDFWDHSIGRGELRLVLMTMPSHAAMLRTAAVMRRLVAQAADTAPRFVVAGIGYHADEMAALRAEGVELVHDVLSEAGYGLIEHVRRELAERGHDWAGPDGPHRDGV